MVVWEPGKHSEISRLLKPQSGARYDTAISTNRNDLPAELLILSRFGVRERALILAYDLGQKFGLHPVDVLIRAKMITPETWRTAQALLEQERLKARERTRFRELLLYDARFALNDATPEYSASNTVTNGQILFFTLLLAGVLLLAQANVHLLAGILILLITVFYTGGVVMRALMIGSLQPYQRSSKSLVEINEARLPVYSVLIALYKEKRQIRALTNALKALEWPKEKLDIKLICEEDDPETIAAVRELNLPLQFDLIIVPDASPKTKPKALNFALPLCKGEYLVLYDAEDRPSPLQLREAYRKFTSEDDKLVCLQAPLEIHNSSQSWLSRMFAIEYITLFRGILPVLAKWDVPMPLGGTSNHFKVRQLKELMGWDPYNVTEDADLGIRIYRYGYRCSTITLPTYEEAPPFLVPWTKQRTRWLKGWMQTILVHNRNPAKLVREIGWRRTFAFHLFLTSIVISALIHPYFLYTTAGQLLNFHTLSHSGIDHIILGTSVFNLVGGYTTYVLLAYAILEATSNRQFSRSLIWLPFYWMLISIAAWRAIFDLIIRPHFWEKTPHGFSKK